MMKRYGLLFCLLFPLTLLQGADITTTKGKTYYNYTVASYSAEGLTILHRQGAVMIPLEEWPENRREEIKKYVAKIEKRRKAISKRPDLTTKTGAVLRKYKILRFSESGAHISHWGGVSIVKVEELPDEIQKKYQKQIDQTKPKVLIVETEQQESNFPKNIELTGAKKKSKKKADDEEGEGMALDMSVNTGKGNVSIGTGGKSSSKSAKKSKSSRSSKKSK